ncbi:MAG: 50S ribosomal protein L18 [Phycisphaerae bacterium]|nr:50S ribosomal protein L18 [Phycisphaerae bacterium]
MNRLEIKTARHTRRKAGIRKRVLGVPSRLRLSVYRSLDHIYAQVIDDLKGHTVAAASSRDKGFKVDGDKKAVASAVGKALAVKATQAGVQQVVFDRNGFRYHGRVKALADGAREGGLKF